MNITNISRTIFGLMGPDSPAPPIPSGGFTPTGTMQPPGTTLFSVDVPPDYLDIGTVAISFGGECANAGAGSYLSTCDLTGTGGSFLGGSRTVTFTDAALPCFSSGSDPDNQAALDELTCQFSVDFQEWLSIQFDYVFAGTVNIQPNGFVDEIEVEYNAGMAKTRIRSMPLNGWPRELGHEDPDCPRPGVTGNLIPGVVTTQVPANSFGGPGKVQLYRESNSGPLPSGKPVKVSNWFGANIAVGKHVLVGRIGCRIYIVSADC